MNSAPLLPAYYCDIFQREDVSSHAPVHCDLAEAVRTLNCLHSERAFMGLILSERVTLQFCRCGESGALRTEWLDLDERRIVWTRLSLPLAEAVVRCTFQGSPGGEPPSLSVLQECVAGAFVPWQTEPFAELPAV